MPSKKRDRANPTPSRTLHDFFSTPKAPSKPKASSSKSQPRSSRPKPHEIIVIDSDSDNEIEIVGPLSEAKRRRLSPKGELPAPATTSSSSLSAKDTTTTPTPATRHKKRSSLDTKENEVIVEDDYRGPVLSFGKSTLCLSNWTDPTVEDCPNDVLELPTFGRSTLRLSPDPQPSTASASGSTDDIKPPPVPVGDYVDWEDVAEEEDLEILDESLVQGFLDDEPKLPKEEDEDIELQLVDDPESPFTIKGEAHDESNLSSSGGGGTSNGGNAFSFLMTSHKENAAWKEASNAEKQPFRPTKANGRRKAPFYKVLQGMPIAVDAFRYGAIPNVTAYFLTHAHSDHYTNLSSSWKHGPIYCSEGTANLIMHMLSVPKKWVHPLPMDTPTEIPNTGGVTVTLIEANHCPGSCLFFFEGRQTVNAGDSNFHSQHIGTSRVFRYLHCGDFRASPQHVNHPAVKGKQIDHVYLDTTYLDPRYTFPAQPLVISACADLAKQLILGVDPPEKAKSSFLSSWVSSAKGKEKATTRSLIVVGTYSIGKERVVKAIANAIGSKIYCDDRKAAILRCEPDSELNALLTKNPLEASVHLVPLGTISTDRLKIYMDRFKDAYDRVIGFRPTGWTYAPPNGTEQMPTVASIVAKASQKTFTSADLRLSPKSTSTMQLYPVPYSEHSSFSELTCFALSINWTKMIATVNVGSEASRGKMAKWVSRWEVERKKRDKDYVVPHRHPEYW